MFVCRNQLFGTPLSPNLSKSNLKLSSIWFWSASGHPIILLSYTDLCFPLFLLNFWTYNLTYNIIKWKLTLPELSRLNFQQTEFSADQGSSWEISSKSDRHTATFFVWELWTDLQKYQVFWILRPSNMNNCLLHVCLIVLIVVEDCLKTCWVHAGK